MHDYTAYMVTDMLRTVVNSGTGTAANVPGLDVAGKTGTTNFDAKTSAQFGYPSNATNDSWFAGYTPQYTMAVWTGYEKNGTGNYMLGDTTKISQQMFRAMMQAFGTDQSSFQQPSDVYNINNELYIKGSKDKYVQPTQNENPSDNVENNDNGGNNNGDQQQQDGQQFNEHGPKSKQDGPKFKPNKGKHNHD
jgi:penicillin-binding protein 1A